MPIGRAYLTQHPNETGVDLLTDWLLDDAVAAGCGPAAAGQIGELCAELQDAVRRDFRHGNVECLNGWCLSRTEARLCALRYLTFGSPV